VRGSYESPPTEPPDPKGLLRHSPSGAKPDPADAHLLAEIVRLDRAHHRRLAGDSAEAEAIKLVARTHQSMIWDRSREVLRLRSAVRDFFPAALKAVPDLDAPTSMPPTSMPPTSMPPTRSNSWPGQPTPTAPAS
jgi:Transposase